MQRFNLVLLVVGVLPCSQGRLTESKRSLDTSYGNSSYQLQPPDYVHICYKDEVDFSDCVSTTMRGVLRRLVDGIPEMYVPPLEALSIAEVDAFDVAGLRFKPMNILCRGGNNMTLLSTRASLDPGKFAGKYEFVTSLDRALLSADMEVSSSIQLIPFVMTARATATALDLKFFVSCHTNVVNRNGIDFFSVESLNLKMEVGSATGILWIGEQRMDLLSIILSSPFNARIIINALRLGLEPTFEGIMLRFAERMFGSVPYDVLIPDHRPQTNVLTVP